MNAILTLLTGIEWKSIFGFLGRHLRETTIVVLAILLMLKYKENNVLQDNLDKASGQLRLKDGEMAKFVIENNHLRSAGTGKGSSEPGYVPPESSVVAVLRKNLELATKLDALNKKLSTLQSSPGVSSTVLEALKKERDDLASRVFTLDITYNKFGFVFHPGVGVVYSTKFLPEADFKFFFWNRWSCEFGLTQEYLGLGISRHVDDLTPPSLHLSNTEIQILFGKEYDFKSWRVGPGIRVNL